MTDHPTGWTGCGNHFLAGGIMNVVAKGQDMRSKPKSVDIVNSPVRT